MVSQEQPPIINVHLLGEHQSWAWLLDDNLMSSTRLEPQLRAMNNRVSTARSVTVVVREAEWPQLIRIDLGSRGLNGVGLIQACRERFGGVRVVGLCGHLEIKIQRTAKAAGINKVFTIEQALSELKQVLL